jgi:transposase
MLRAISEGEFDEGVLSQMARGSMKSKANDLKQALKGLIQPHQQMIIASMLSHIDALDLQIESLDEEIARRLSDREQLVKELDGIAGVGEKSAQVILAEIGSDMSKFRTSKNLVSWAGLAPGQNESAGKKKVDEQEKVIQP